MVSRSGAGQSPAVSAHLVKVKVDPETGQVQPAQYVIVQDVGLALNPLLVEGQLHGGMVQGLGMDDSLGRGELVQATRQEGGDAQFTRIHRGLHTEMPFYFRWLVAPAVQGEAVPTAQVVERVAGRF